MKRSLTILLVLILVGVVFAGCAKTTGSVTGTVTDKSTGSPISGASVAIGGKQQQQAVMENMKLKMYQLENRH